MVSTIEKKFLYTFIDHATIKMHLQFEIHYHNVYNGVLREENKNLFIQSEL